MDKYCYEDTCLGGFSQKYFCDERLAGVGCCYQRTDPPKTWENCPFGKLHKHYQVDLEAEHAKLAKAKIIKAAVLNEINPLLEEQELHELMKDIQSLNLEDVINNLL